jgi:hypothetical protein
MLAIMTGFARKFFNGSILMISPIFITIAGNAKYHTIIELTMEHHAQAQCIKRSTYTLYARDTP